MARFVSLQFDHLQIEAVAQSRAPLHQQRVEDLRLLERLVQKEMDRLDLEDARAALREAEEKGTIPLRDVMRSLGLSTGRSRRAK